MEGIELLLAEREITRVIFRYARAIDRMDEPLLRSVFHPGSLHRHFYEGPSSDPDAVSTPEAPGDFVAFALGVLSGFIRTQHQLGNTLIDFDDATHARAETYFIATHRMRPLGDPLAPANAAETEMDYFVGGRYLDHFELREGEWKIVHRIGMTDWMRLDGPSGPGLDGVPPDTVGARAPDDPVCGFYSV
jgi:hypothetical protein